MQASVPASKQRGPTSPSATTSIHLAAALAGSWMQAWACIQTAWVFDTNINKQGARRSYMSKMYFIAPHCQYELTGAASTRSVVQPSNPRAAHLKKGAAMEGGSRFYYIASYAAISTTPTSSFSSFYSYLYGIWDVWSFFWGRCALFLYSEGIFMLAVPCKYQFHAVACTFMHFFLVDCERHFRAWVRCLTVCILTEGSWVV